jgi:LacI family transcriptional regulator, galactose operon repressor
MRAVAKLADVSVSSVSRVLSDHEDVSEHLRKRVMTAVRRLKYQPDFLAQSLRRGATLSIGYIVGDISNPLIATITSGAESVLRAAGYSMLIMDSDNNPDYDAANIQFFTARRVDGLILSLASERHPATLEILTRLDIPVVVIDREIPPQLGASVVRTDHRSGVRSAVDALLDLGHRRIAQITGPLDLWPIRERVAGMKDAVEARRIPDETLTIAGSLSSAHGYAATEQLLGNTPRPTAIIAGGNQVLMGCLRALSRHEVRIPADISLITCDNVALAELHVPPIAAIDRNTRELGRIAAELLLRRVGGSHVSETVTLATTFVAGGSYGPPPAEPEMHPSGSALRRSRRRLSTSAADS